MRKVELLVIVGTAVVIIVRSFLGQVNAGRFVSVKLQLALGSLIGLVSAAAVLSDRINLVADHLEWPLAIAFVSVAGMTWAVTSVWRRRQERRSSARWAESPAAPVRALPDAQLTPRSHE